MNIRRFLIIALFLTAGCANEESIDQESNPRVKALRDSLTQVGLYDCCIKPACLHCTQAHGQCDCYLDIKAQRPICKECLEGFKDGIGKLKLVSIPELERIRIDSASHKD